jgi:transposase
LTIFPGPAHRGVFPPEVRAQAVALACSRPQEQEVPLARWSAREIARRLIALGLVAVIAVCTVSRWLVQDQLRPWRYHNWQHILDPKAFLERARPVLRLYEQAKALLHQGTWVVCTDEKTSLQAREREQLPRPAQAEQPVLVSPRYKRHGAWHLFAALSVADGQVYGQCRARKCFRDFCAFLTEVLIPEARRRQVQTLALILDNGSTHASKQLAAWLQSYVAGLPEQLAIEIYWLPKNASWLDQIEIWFSILQRKLLQPNDFASLEALQKAIWAFIRYYNETAKPIHWTYTVEKLEQKLGQN